MNNSYPYYSKHDSNKNFFGNYFHLKSEALNSGDTKSEKSMLHIKFFAVAIQGRKIFTHGYN